MPDSSYMLELSPEELIAVRTLCEFIRRLELDPELRLDLPGPLLQAAGSVSAKTQRLMVGE